ncbi:hypothetical protein LCGC14_2291050 [marine sediment metagenome]|uniref:Right handed beta helix domain-containing protein n=1 Tax=marine sediment metagenome TaxID=412755 RepID=A0A0F9FLH4_9ZZZZ
MTIGTGTSFFTRKTSGAAFNVEDQGFSTGDRYFVDSGATNAANVTNGGSNPDAPFLTVAFAITQATAGQGDIIYVMPGHAESSTTINAEIWDISKAGISIIGLGEGDLRPTFTLGQAGVTCVIGAAGCMIKNLRFVGDIVSLVAMLEVEAAADGCVIEDCFFTDSAAQDALIMISVAADADRLVIQRNQFVGIVGLEATDCILFAGNTDATVIRDNLFAGDWKTSGAIGATAAKCNGMVILRNIVSNADGAAGLSIKMKTDNTGIVAYNAFTGTSANTEPVTGEDAMHIVENYMADVAAKTGIISATVTVW